MKNKCIICSQILQSKFREILRLFGLDIETGKPVSGLPVYNEEALNLCLSEFNVLKNKYDL